MFFEFASSGSWPRVNASCDHVTIIWSRLQVSVSQGEASLFGVVISFKKRIFIRFLIRASEGGKLRFIADSGSLGGHRHIYVFVLAVVCRHSAVASPSRKPRYLIF